MNSYLITNGTVITLGPDSTVIHGGAVCVSMVSSGIRK